MSLAAATELVHPCWKILALLIAITAAHQKPPAGLTFISILTSPFSQSIYLCNYPSVLLSFNLPFIQLKLLQKHLQAFFPLPNTPPRSCYSLFPFTPSAVLCCLFPCLSLFCNLGKNINTLFKSDIMVMCPKQKETVPFCFFPPSQCYQVKDVHRDWDEKRCMA